jgi:diguanylate cyclase (GGDEF)-like protein/PAS domain S-box-containing protein
MSLVKEFRRWFYLGTARTPASRALLIEQFRILTSQIPVLYGVLIVESISIAYVLPGSLAPWFRFGVPGALLLISAIRMVYWVRLRNIVPTPEQALTRLFKTRILACALNAVFSLWTLMLFDSVGLNSRAPFALLVFMGSVGSAYCLASFPSAARLTLLISALPISLRLMLSGEALLVCIGLNLCLLLALLVRMMNTNYADLVNLVASRVRLRAESDRARTAEAAAIKEQAKVREIAERFDTALNNMSQGLCLFDGEQRLLVCNDNFSKLYGIAPGRIGPGITLREIVDLRFEAGSSPATGKEKYLTWRQTLVASEKPSDTTMELKNGRTIRIHHQPMSDQGWVATHEDITEQKLAEEDLRRTKLFLDTVIESVPMPILVKTAKDSRFMLLNKAGEDLFGFSRDYIIGKIPHEVYDETRANSVLALDKEALHSDKPIVALDHFIPTSKRGVRIVTSKKVAIKGSNGKPEYLLSVIDDVTERREAERRISHMALNDLLTDLPNRAAFNERLSTTLKEAGADRRSFAIMCMDLDNFKEVNDVYGHAVGDLLLRQVAGRLRGGLSGAFVARLGGDEFTIISGNGSRSEIRRFADRLLAAFAADFEIEGHRLRQALSIGIAMYPGDGTDAETLMKNADAALYRAKKNSPGTIQFFEAEMATRLRERAAMQADLRSAIQHNELFLHYQPQLKMTGDVVGFEALARWHSAQRGMVPPDEFIPLAEESSLILSMGEWVLREACLEAITWQKPLRIAINVSPIQFRHGDLPTLVHSVLLQTGLAPGRLELEITEGVLIDDFSRAVSILRRLKSLGVQIALDDFGTGYSSLSYLHAFPFDKIKIDRSFISEVDSNRHSIAIVRAVIGLGRSLGIPVLAEGVETEAQHVFLAREGCHEVQGYLTGRPREISEYAALVGLKTSGTPYSRAV